MCVCECVHIWKLFQFCRFHCIRCRFWLILLQLVPNTVLSLLFQFLVYGLAKYHSIGLRNGYRLKIQSLIFFFFKWPSTGVLYNLFGIELIILLIPLIECPNRVTWNKNCESINFFLQFSEQPPKWCGRSPTPYPYTLTGGNEVVCCKYAELIKLFATKYPCVTFSELPLLTFSVLAGLI